MEHNNVSQPPARVVVFDAFLDIDTFFDDMQITRELVGDDYLFHFLLSALVTACFTSSIGIDNYYDNVYGEIAFHVENDEAYLIHMAEHPRVKMGCWIDMDMVVSDIVEACMVFVDMMRATHPCFCSYLIALPEGWYMDNYEYNKTGNLFTIRMHLALDYLSE